MVKKITESYQVKHFWIFFKLITLCGDGHTLLFKVVVSVENFFRVLTVVALMSLPSTMEQKSSMELHLNHLFQELINQRTDTEI